MSSSELKENAVNIARHLLKPIPEWETSNDDEQNSKGRRGRRDTIHQLLMQHKKLKDWSNLETNFKREFFKDGELRIKSLELSRKTISILDDMRKSMAEYQKERKVSALINPYLASNDSCYSLATSAYSDKDSFTIYQRASYRPPIRTSPIPSVNYSANINLTFSNSTDGIFPLKSAMKKSRTAPILQTKGGIDNLSFVNDEEENLRENFMANSTNNLTEIDEEEVGDFGESDSDENEYDENADGFEMKISERKESNVKEEV